MLFVLDAALQDRLHGATEREIAAFEALAAGHREASHYLSGPRRLLRALAGWNALSGASRATFHRLEALVATRACLADALPVYTVVRPDGAFHRAHHGRRTVFTLPLEQITTTVMQKTVLLGENQDDACLYAQLGHAALTDMCLPDTTVGAYCQGGGGSTTYREFEALQASGRPLLCVTDSDKSSPDAPIGATAGAVRRAWRRNEAAAEVYILKTARYAANLIPLATLRALYPDGQATLRRLIALADSPAAEVLPWLDIERALQVDNLPRNGFWRRHRAMLRRHSFPGLGKKVLERLNQKLLAQDSPRGKRRIFEPHFQGELAELGALVAAWCCAVNPRGTGKSH